MPVGELRPRSHSLVVRATEMGVQILSAPRHFLLPNTEIRELKHPFSIIDTLVYYKSF